MTYMERNRARDVPATVLEGAKSVIAVALNARPVDGERTELGRIASYGLGYDYHRILEHKLGELTTFIRGEVGAELRARIAVDRLPLLERDAAFVAGIGWFGKNAMIMNRQHGSALLLGELVVDLELSPCATLPTEHCGSCTACLEACPTNAFVAPGLLDARQCISYLTMELRESIPRELRSAMGDHLFGCDVCQQVCPWNKHAASETTQEFAFLGRPEILDLSPLDLLEMDGVGFRDRLVLSPLQRAKRAGMARNAAVVLGNTGDRRWVPHLAGRLRREADAMVRQHVAWAMGAIGGAGARVDLERARLTEDDARVVVEIELALEGAS
jgi:epoxyqueuosine reductase